MIHTLKQLMAIDHTHADSVIIKIILHVEINLSRIVVLYTWDTMQDVVLVALVR